MRKLRLTLAIGVLALPALSQNAQSSDLEPPRVIAGEVYLAEQGGQPAVEGHPDADNTKRNIRDRDDSSLTPMDQGGSESDRNITAEIRKAVVDHDGLSVNAQNVKIITRDGIVTLRGPVKSPEEKTTIANVATKTAGVKRVDNQLEVERDR